jgi:hypothetical protein
MTTTNFNMTSNTTTSHSNLSTMNKS